MRALTLFFFALSCYIFGSAQSENREPHPQGGYRLYPRDLVRVEVFNEPEMTAERRIDATGAIALPTLGATGIGGLTVAEAQEKIRQAYIQKEIFVQPEVSLTVVDYVPREASVLGQVKDPGKVKFPNEDNALEIVDVISKAGGITRIGKSDSVRVTRKNPDGSEQTFTVNVERMFDGRGGAKSFLVLPGDVIFIPERVL